MLGGWAVGTGAVILLGASVEGTVEGTVVGSSEGPFGASAEESVGSCSVGASVKCEFIVLVLPVELVVGMLVIAVQLVRVGPTDERILAKLCLLLCTVLHIRYIQVHSYIVMMKYFNNNGLRI